MGIRLELGGKRRRRIRGVGSGEDGGDGKDQQGVDDISQHDVLVIVAVVRVIADLAGQLAEWQMPLLHEHFREFRVALAVLQPVLADEAEDVVLGLSRVSEIGIVVSRPEVDVRAEVEEVGDPAEEEPHRG